MNEKRKTAYRKILYNFLIQIKQPEIPTDASALITGQHAAVVAYALHNFALAAANDFVNFDEASFWRRLDAWHTRYPAFGFNGFQQMFEWDLAEDNGT